MRSAGAALTVVMALAGCARQAQPDESPPDTSGLEVLGHHGRISMARARLGPSETLRIAASRCQDVLVFIEEGAARFATEGNSWMRHGRAVRLNGPTTVLSAPAGRTEMFAVAVLSDTTAAEEVDWSYAPDDDSCGAPANTVAESDPTRSGPFLHADGRLAVMIYLDAEPGGRALASLGTLDGDSTLGVPEHVHETSAEVLWIEDGSGTMRVGDENRRIKPGTFVYVPPQTVHGFEPDGTRPLFAYQVYTPSGPEQRFRN